MANLTNKDLSIICTSTGNWQYIKSQYVTSSPVGNLSIGKEGDFFWVEGANKDGSLNFKTSSGWVSFIADASV